MSKKKNSFFLSKLRRFCKEQICFGTFSQFLGKLQKSQILPGTLLPPLPFTNSSISPVFFVIFGKSQTWHLLLDTFQPPLTLKLINFSNFCHFSNILEKSQKLQFLLGALLPPLTLEFSNFNKFCDFSNFFYSFGRNRSFFSGRFPPLLTLN